MAENVLLRHGPADEKEYQGGQLGEEVIRGVDWLPKAKAQEVEHA